ncbi:MAG: right-handed parallel beta-helix repeat-containing protein [Bacteroidota bacterium]
MNGTYTNDCETCSVLEIFKSGSKNKFITFKNYPGHKPVIIFNGWAGISIRSGVSYVAVSGFEVIGNNDKITLKQALQQPGNCKSKKSNFDPRFNGNGIAIEGKTNKYAHHIVIRNNKVHDCGGGGIGAVHADYITVEDNLVYNNSWYSLFGTSGISFYQFRNYDHAKGYHNFIRRNKCFNNNSFVPWFKTCEINDGNGIIIDDFRNRQNGSKLGRYESRTLIENNICWYNGGTGIHTFQSDHVDIINNTAYCNSQGAGLKAGQILSGMGDDNKIVNNILISDANVPINSNYSNTNLTYENNLHYNVTNPSKAIVNVTSPTCLSTSPLFVRAGNNISADFRLQQNSPAIDRGNTAWRSLSDFNGSLRKDGRADIGAYEYH